MRLHLSDKNLIACNIESSSCIVLFKTTLFSNVDDFFGNCVLLASIERHSGAKITQAAHVSPNIIFLKGVRDR